ncbi:ATP-binding cassette domain-containing protein [Streptomyces sp. NPDC003036]|uniref:ABC transporter ATP-binding protein n=1 Tax=Streptomyces sp. NPDC003036 TaxID=3154442 RepID=UPI0033B0A513
MTHIQPPALALVRASRTYGAHRAVSEVTLHVGAGEVVGLLGANGAGKTTLMRMACGLIRPSSGTVEVFGKKPPLTLTDARNVGAALDTPAFYPWMTGPAQLRSLLHSSGVPDRGQVDRALERVGLDDQRRKRIRAYSQGMRHRLALAAALLRQPRLLVLDEPTNALDPHAIAQVRAIIREEQQRGTAILISSHQLDEVQRLCQRVVVLDRGRVAAQGTVEDIGLDGATSLAEWFFNVSGHEGSW